jgi:hypothetical protein
MRWYAPGLLQTRTLELVGLDPVVMLLDTKESWEVGLTTLAKAITLEIVCSHTSVIVKVARVSIEMHKPTQESFVMHASAMEIVTLH